MAPGLDWTRPDSAISMTPPALMIPACSRAETGVGASITSVSQPCTGKAAHFSAAASTRKPMPICADRGNAAVPFIRTIERAIAGTTRPLPVAGLAGFSRGDR